MGVVGAGLCQGLVVLEGIVVADTAGLAAAAAPWREDGAHVRGCGVVDGPGQGASACSRIMGVDRKVFEEGFLLRCAGGNASGDPRFSLGVGVAIEQSMPLPGAVVDFAPFPTPLGITEVICGCQGKEQQEDAEQGAPGVGAGQVNHETSPGGSLFSCPIAWRGLVAVPCCEDPQGTMIRY